MKSILTNRLGKLLDELDASNSDVYRSQNESLTSMEKIKGQYKTTVQKSRKN